MKAIAMIIAAVATLLGVGWYFSNAQVAAEKPVAVQSRAAKVAEFTERNEPKLPTLKDENEIVGAYVPRKMVYPKDPSLARNVKMNDELLILEAHSEDRLSVTR